MDIVYSLCGNNGKEELLRSLISLATLITAAEAADSSTILVYNVHLITDGSIGFGDLPPMLLSTALTPSNPDVTVFQVIAGNCLIMGISD